MPKLKLMLSSDEYSTACEANRMLHSTCAIIRIWRKVESTIRSLRGTVSFSLSGNQRGYVDIVFSDLAVETRTVDSQKVSGRLFVSTRSLQSLLDH